MRKVFMGLGLFFSIWFSVAAQILPADTSHKDFLHHSPSAETSAAPKNQIQKQVQKAGNQENARQHINALKSGVLLVRLRTTENAIKNLEKAGNQKMAETLRQRQKATNLLLMKAFKHNFTFCPVYFFYSSDTDKLINEAKTGYFLNDTLAIDPSLTLPARAVYIAEITDLEQFRPDPDDLNANNNAEVTFKALVVRDKYLHQLAKPFPYFVKAAQNFPPRKRSEKEMVANLNKNLNAFYEANLVKKIKKKRA